MDEYVKILEDKCNELLKRCTIKHKEKKEVDEDEGSLQANS